MAGFRRFWVLAGIFIPFLAIFLMSQNVAAVTFTENLHYVQTLSIGGWKCYYRRSDVQTITELSSPCNIPAISGADAASITRYVSYMISNRDVEFKKGHIYEVQISTRISQGTTAIDYPIPVIWSVSTGPDPVGLVLRDIRVNYENRGNANSITTFNGTPLTIDTYPQEIVYYSLYFQATRNGTDKFYVGRPSSSNFFNLPPTASSSLYVPPFQISPLVSIFEYTTTTPSEEAAEKDLEGTSNIEDQTPQSTTGGTSESQQTTSIIGTISSFVGAFSNITPASSCQMSLPFPDFVGGNQVVDICQGKEKAPALISAASSILLIVTFVPVAFIVLSMIFREIRSFTNG